MATNALPEGPVPAAEVTDTSIEVTKAGKSMAKRSVSLADGPFKEKIRSDRRRTRSNSNLLSEITADTNYDTLGKDAFKKIVERLRQEHLWSSRIVRGHFKWLLPKEGQSKEQFQIFKQLQLSPMTISNIDLAKILDIEQSTQACPPTEPGHHFYIRAWTLAPEELHKVVDYMRDEDETFQETTRWSEIIDLHIGAASGPEFLTVRYIGQCQSPIRPYDRYMADLRQRSSGILHDFIHAVEMLYPEIGAAAEVHLLKPASVDLIRTASGEVVSRYNADDVERVLIEFFDHATLLNRQRGGFYAGYVPRADDVDTFQALETTFYQQLRGNSTQPDDDMFAKLNSHFESVRDFANAHPAITGTYAHLFTESLEEVTRNQALPQLYKGSNILVLIGRDISLADYLAERTFLSGYSRAGFLTRDFLHRNAQAEAECGGRMWLDQSFNPALFPYINLWPWLKHDDINNATRFLLEYLRITRPLIAATYSRKVTTIAKANFIHQNGVFSTSFVQQVGELSLQCYSEPNEGGIVDDENAFICIPHIDPGKDKYGSAFNELRRVLDLTHKLTNLVGSLAMQAVDRTATRRVLSRNDLCLDILKDVDRYLTKTHAGRVFKENLSTAKSNLHAKWSKVYNWIASDTCRPILNAQGMKVIAAMGQARGLPGTSLRRKQLEALWGKQADLHMHIPYEASRKEDWIAEFMPLAENQYYYLQALSKFPPDEYLKLILQDFRPELTDEDSWLNNEADRSQSTLQCGLWIHKKLPGGVAEEKRLIKNHFPHAPIPTSEMQGHSIGVHADRGQFTVRWKRNDGTNVNVRLTCALVVPRNPHDIRAISFTEHGIDVVDASGTPFRRTFRSGKVNDASIPYANFASIEQGEIVKELWTEVLKVYGIQVPAEALKSDRVKDWGTKKGVKHLSKVAKVEKPLQNRPPLPSNSNYLLNAFLDRRFPEGGIFRTASKDLIPSSTEDLQAFIQFLRSPESSAHPYTSVWLAELDKEMPNVGILFKNIYCYRACIKTIKQSFQSHLKHLRETQRYISEVSYELGPPGSASTKPWPATTYKPRNPKTTLIEKQDIRKISASIRNDVEEDNEEGDCWDEQEESRIPLGRGSLKKRKTKTMPAGQPPPSRQRGLSSPQSPSSGGSTAQNCPPPNLSPNEVDDDSIKDEDKERRC